MTLLPLAVCVAVAFLLFKRMDAMALTIDGLTDRIDTLEAWRQRLTASEVATTAGARAPASPTPSPVVHHGALRPREAAPFVAAPLQVEPPREAAHPVEPPPQTKPLFPADAIPPVTLASPTDASVNESLETRIGSRWLLYVGVVAIVIGASYFVKLAIDNRWISETARVIQGGVAGLVLVNVGLRFVRGGYQLYGRMICGCGVAILYVSTYAAFNYYHLISRPIAFGLMCAVTTLAAWLANGQRSQSLAVVAVGGGFATPLLLRSGVDAQVALFGYEAILIAGTMFLARRRAWPTLNSVSYVFTVMTVAGWAARFYEPSKYLTTELFLTLFCAMYLYILRESRHSDDFMMKTQRAILWTAPLFYYGASLAILEKHPAALLIYLVVLSLVGVITSFRVGALWRVVLWSTAVAPLLLWCTSPVAQTWLAAALAAWSGIYLLNLIGLVKRALEPDCGSGRAMDVALLHLNGLAAFAGAYVLIDPVHPTSTALVAAGFAVWHLAIGATLAVRNRDIALHFVALASTLLAMAIALHFDGVWTTIGWAAEGAALVALGLRERREWLRLSGLTLVVTAIVQLTMLQFSDPPVGQLLLRNQRAACGIFVVALTYLLTLANHRYRNERFETALGLLTGNLLVLSLAVSEISAYWTVHSGPRFESTSHIADAFLIVGAATMWLGLFRRQEFIRLVGGAVVAVGTWLLLSVQLEPMPQGYLFLLNSRAAAGVLAVALCCALADVHRRIGSHVADLSVNIAVFTTAAALLTLSFLTSEIDAFWSARGAADLWSVAREGVKAIAWSTVGSFLVWQGLSNRRSWMRGIGAVILAVAIFRLLYLQFGNPAPAYVIANARVVAAVIVIACIYGLARLYRDANDVLEGQYWPSTVLLFIANVVTLTMLTSEITAYWHLRDLGRVARDVSQTSHFAREMMLSVTWALYATGLIVAGLRKQYPPIRYFAIGLFVITIVKVFAIDLAELRQIYRVLSVLGLGVMLLVTSYLYHRTRMGEEVTAGSQRYV